MAKKESRNSTGLSDFRLNKENPFLKQAVERVQEKVVKKYKTATNTGESAILKAVDKDNNPVGHTSFIRQIEVDEEQFTKFYLSNFSSFFDLKPQAIKVFGYILKQLVPNKDEFMFLLEDCQEYTGYKSETSVRIGLTALLKADIIARGRADFLYFINPMIVFNGSRIAFAKTYIKKQKSEPERIVFEEESPIINPNQTNLLDQIKEMENE